MKKCRACLTTDCLMIPIDEEFVCNYNILTNLDVRISDDFFQFVCETCLKSVKYFVDFREKCILSETSLRSIAAEVKLENVINQDVDNIKAEYEIDCDNSFLDSVDFAHDIDIIIKDEDIEDKIKIKQYRKKRKYTRVAEQQTWQLLCGLCPKEFVNRSKLSNHFDDHKMTTNCLICLQSFRDWPQLLAHRLKHLPNNQKYCHLCSKRFYSAGTMEFHYRKNHFDEKNVLLHCNICTHTFDNPRKLQKHIWGVHSNKSFICDYCAKVFSNKQHLKIHIFSHLDYKKYLCDMCQFSCKYSGGLKDHKIRKHMPKKVYCRDCTRPFENQLDYEKHKCKAKSPEICTVCGLQLTGSMRLSRHMETHKEVGSFKCTRCPKVYKTRSALVTHVNKHDGNRTKHCEFCPAKFYYASALIKHRRIHTGEKPYVCKICKRGFTGNNNLKVHMKVHGQHNLIVKKVKPEVI